MNHINSSLCRVLKEVYTRPIEEYSCKISKLPDFFTGSSLVIQLWLGTNFDYCFYRFYLIFIKQNSNFNDITEANFRDCLMKTFEQLYSQFVFTKLSMFEYLNGSELEKNCNKIVSLLISNILSESKDLSYVYFINSVTGDSFSIWDEGIHLVKKGDEDYLSKLSKKDIRLSNINIHKGEIFNIDTYETHIDFDYAIIIENKNSFNNSTLLAQSKLTKLSSIIHANHVSRYSKKPIICCGEQRTTLIQLSNPDENTNYSWSSIPVIIPPYCGGEIELDSKDQANIQESFKQIQRLSKPQQNQIDTCLHYYNLGMQSTTDIGFLHYSIALDALFGEKGRSEKSIEEGIMSLGLTNIDTSLIEQLYDLRCCLIHGGTKSIENWEKYPHYRKHYGREPFSDLQTIISNAVLSWPTLHVKM